MALTDLKVYSEFAYTTFTEVLRQQVNLFNGASNGAIQLGVGAHLGDYSDQVFWKKVAGLVRRRNAYGTGAVSGVALAQEVDTMVKVAAGTPPIDIAPSQFLWIQQNPEVAGVVLGKQLAVEALADMLNTGLGAFYAAHLTQASTNVLDISARTAPADKMSVSVLAEGSGKLGDQSGGAIQAWVMHSKPMFDIYANTLANANQLFVYGNVAVSRDPFGKLLIMTDSPSLVTAGSPNMYHTLGLKQGAIVIDRNNDFIANEETSNGQENIQRTYQAEWSFELGIMGFAWDKVNGGKSPTQAALLTGTNWDKIVTSSKDLGGVVIESH